MPSKSRSGKSTLSDVIPRPKPLCIMLLAEDCTKGWTVAISATSEHNSGYMKRLENYKPMWPGYESTYSVLLIRTFEPYRRKQVQNLLSNCEQYPVIRLWRRIYFWKNGGYLSKLQNSGWNDFKVTSIGKEILHSIHWNAFPRYQIYLRDLWMVEITKVWHPRGKDSQK